MDRFFAADWDPNQSSVTLDEMESHHLAKVLRKSLGDVVELFDGNGQVATASVERISKREVQLRIVEKSVAEPVLTPSLTLAVAPPKGDRFRWLVEKATELGVDRLIPLETRRSVVSPRDGKLEKMRQAVIAACKQSRRNRLMEILDPIAWDELLNKWIPSQASWLAHPTGSAWAENQRDSDATSLLFVIGPEGGFTDEEVAAATVAGAKAVSLGQYILRIETAAVAIAAAIGLHR